VSDFWVGVMLGAGGLAGLIAWIVAIIVGVCCVQDYRENRKRKKHQREADEYIKKVARGDSDEQD